MSEEEPAYTELSRETHLYRAHRADENPVFFGPPPGEDPRNRFDAPAGQFRVCYTARSPAGAFVETFLRDPDLAGHATPRILAASELRDYQISCLGVLQSLTLARLRGPGLSWRGVDAAVSSTCRYAETRELALRVYREEEPRPAGIEYRTRHDDDELAIALFDHARPGLALFPDPDRLAGTALSYAREFRDRYPYVIDENA